MAVFEYLFPVERLRLAAGLAAKRDGAKDEGSNLL